MQSKNLIQPHYIVHCHN